MENEDILDENLEKLRKQRITRAAETKKKKLRRIRHTAVITLLVALTIGLSLYAYFEAADREARELALIEAARRRLEEALTNTPPSASPTPTEPPAATPRPSYIPGIAPTPKPKTIRDEYLMLMEEYGNEDIVGRLKINGTSIDYIVVQTEDNEYYLEHDIEKKYSSAGWIFLDFENDITRSDPNSIIYGHNMKAQIMFHDLRYYLDEEYYKTHKYINFNTLYEDQTWEIFSFYISDIYFSYINVYFDSYDNFFTLATEMKRRSIYDTGVELVKGDRVLTLSTCTGYPGPETRFVINARLMERADIESLEQSIPEITN